MTYSIYHNSLPISETTTTISMSLIINDNIRVFSHAQTVRDSSSSYNIEYVIVIKNFQNFEGHQNPISGSEVRAILLKGWIWPIGGAASVRVCACSLHSRLVIINPYVKHHNYIHFSFIYFRKTPYPRASVSTSTMGSCMVGATSWQYRCSLKYSNSTVGR